MMLRSKKSKMQHMQETMRVFLDQSGAKIGKMTSGSFIHFLSATRVTVWTNERFPQQVKGLKVFAWRLE